MHATTQSPSDGLDAIFHPRSLALIGASEQFGSVGLGLVENLRAFPGEWVCVNPRHDFVLDRRSYPDLAATRRAIDLAIIAVPAPAVPAVVRECVEARVRAAVVISAGFRETGAAGAALEKKVLAEAKRGHLRILGPNSLGVINPHSGLNASFAAATPLKGNLAFLSQSGALCTAILDWSRQHNVGFSSFVSMGSMLDLGWGDMIRHFNQDPHTKSILIYLESIGNARAFVEAAREAARNKPIIVLKAGRSADAARAAASHTGAMTGSDKVADAVLKRLGVLRVETIEELFGMAELAGQVPTPAGGRLAIVTNAGGPAALAADAIIAGGGSVAALSTESLATLNASLPPHWSHGNPVDVLGDAPPGRLADAVTIVAADPGVDGVLTILTPQSMTDPSGSARALVAAAAKSAKPLIASWMGGATVEAGRSILRAAKVPVFEYPESAARALCQLARYGEVQRRLRDTPAPAGPPTPTGTMVAHGDSRMISSARRSGRLILSEYDSKELLVRHGLPCISTRVACTAEDAVTAARQVGFPVALKLHSRTLTHKSDVGGVQLNVGDEAGVQAAWWNIRRAVAEKAGLTHFLGVTVQPMVSGYSGEAILGSMTDPDFGPVIVFGTGGKFTEIYNDIVVAIPPLDAALAGQLLHETKIGAILRGARGTPPVDLAQFEHLITRFSQLIIEQPGIKEIDLNPIVCSEGQLHILDARVILHARGTRSQLPSSCPLVPSKEAPARHGAPGRPQPSRRQSGRKGVDARPAVLASGSPQRMRSHEQKSGASDGRS